MKKLYLHKILLRIIIAVSVTLLFNYSLIAQDSEYKNFHPGEIWIDNNGKHINAHGGGILYENGIYYLFGEHKITGREGNKAR
jgi:hypothetical protein